MKINTNSRAAHTSSPIAIVDIINVPLSKTSQQISLKFYLNPFHVRVVFLSDFGPLFDFREVKNNN